MYDYIPLDKYYMYYLKNSTKSKSCVVSYPEESLCSLPSYLEITPPSRNYVPHVSDSLDSLLQQNPTNGDISETILQDKQKVLGATVQHLKNQIAFRTQIFQEHIGLIDYKIAQCESYLLNLHGFWPYTNRDMEKIRANLGNLVVSLESEKRKETIKWWGDQEPLYTELLKTTGEFMGAKRRYGFLTGDLQ